MYDKRLQLRTSVSEEIVMTKDERYELIAQIAQKYNEFKDSSDVEEKNVWDSSDTDLNFGEFVSNYN